MAEHHKTLSPSSFPAIMLCARFMSSDRQDDDADLGTDLHVFTEAIINGVPPIKTERMSQEDCEDCEWAAQTIKDIIVSRYPKLEHGAVKTEVKLTLMADDLTAISFGTCDVLYYDIIIDLKSGLDFDFDGHHHKPQLAVYSLAQMRLKKLKAIDCHEVYIKMHKTRPYTMGYDQAAGIIESVIARRNDKTLRAQANPYCKYCRYLMHCHELNEREAVVVRAYGRAKDLVEDVESLEDPAVMSKMMYYGKILEKKAKVIKEMGKTMHFDDGKDLPNWQEKSKKGRANMPDMNRAFNLSGLGVDAFMNCCTVSVPKLGEVLAKQAGMTVKAAKNEMAGRLNEVIVLGEPTISLAPDFKDPQQGF